MGAPTENGSSRPPPDPPLRPSLPFPKRLNRNVLTVAAALAGVTVLTVLVVASPSRPREATSMVAADAVPPSAAQPTFLDVPPRLPSAVLNRPSPSVAGAGRLVVGGTTTNSDRARSTREIAYQTALNSEVMVGNVPRRGSGASAWTGAPSLPPTVVAAPGPPDGALASPRVLPLASSDDTAARAVAADTPFALRAGTVITGFLMTGINSDVPGDVVGQTSREIFDSRTQQVLLIPRGSKLIGTYDNRTVRSGRLIVEWTRLLFPDGRSIALPHAKATDAIGESGLHDQVNHHYGRLFGTALLTPHLRRGCSSPNPSRRQRMDRCLPDRWPLAL